jgi:choline dehydrogenase
MLHMRGHPFDSVADASVMPNVTSASLNAPTMMIAERVADMILRKPLLAPEKARFAFEKETVK